MIDTGIGGKCVLHAAGRFITSEPVGTAIPSVLAALEAAALATFGFSEIFAAASSEAADLEAADTTLALCSIGSSSA